MPFPRRKGCRGHSLTASSSPPPSARVPHASLLDKHSLSGRRNSHCAPTRSSRGHSRLHHKVQGAPGRALLTPALPPASLRLLVCRVPSPAGPPHCTLSPRSTPFEAGLPNQFTCCMFSNRVILYPKHRSHLADQPPMLVGIMSVPWAATEGVALHLTVLPF